MRNKIFRLVIVAALMSVSVCGCQKAPESSSNGDILHAKGSVENEVEAIVNEGGTGKEENTLKEINCTIGTEDNAIRIQAQMPDMPENIYNMVLGENDTLTKDLLKDFLGSNSGTIDDLSEEVKKEREKLEVENEQSDERALFSVFGNDSVYELSDGQKLASFSNGTSAYYEDEILREKCISAYKSGSETVLNQVDHKDDYRKMEELLLDKLSIIDLTEIYIYKITSYQNESVTFYEVKFTPSYEGMGVVHEFGSVVYGEVQPLGDAWVCEDDIVTLSLDSSLGKVEKQEKCETVLSWGQIEQILEVNLNNGKINGSDSDKAVLTNVEFLYYPVFQEDENRLVLVPVWHIYTPLSVWLENEELSEAFTTNGAASSICVNAVSGEIVRVE